MGIEMPFVATLPPRKRQRSIAERNALAEAEAIIREAGDGLGS
jgi:hypothetical protein